VDVFTTVVVIVWDCNYGDYLLQERPNLCVQSKEASLSVVSN
jgi:hypothetical protein